MTSNVHPSNILVTAREIMEIAVVMEKAGAEFYGRLADAVGEEKLRKLFLGLMGMEDRHERKMRDVLAKMPADSDEVFEVNTLVIGEDYFRQLGEKAAQRVFPSGGRFQAKVAEFKKPLDAFPLALAAEETSIKLYKFLLKYSLSDEARQAVDQIIREEEGHAREIRRIKKIAESD